jgi:hypothetical protein
MQPDKNPDVSKKYVGMEPFFQVNACCAASSLACRKKMSG